MAVAVAVAVAVAMAVAVAVTMAMTVTVGCVLSERINYDISLFLFCPPIPVFRNEEETSVYMKQRSDSCTYRLRLVG